MAAAVIDDFQVIDIGEIEAQWLNIAKRETKVMQSKQEETAAIVKTRQFIGEGHSTQLMQNPPTHENRLSCLQEEIAKFREVSRTRFFRHREGFDLGQQAAEFIAAGAYALGVGADLIDAAALREGNLEKITSAARELVQAVAAARPAKAERKAS